MCVCVCNAHHSVDANKPADYQLYTAWRSMIVGERGRVGNINRSIILDWQPPLTDLYSHHALE